MNKLVVSAVVLVVVAAAGAWFPVGGDAGPCVPVEGAEMDLSSFSPEKPSRPLRLLFLHHSCGGQLLAEPGPEKQLADCILVSHANGGGLRSRLVGQGYEIHEASYGSELGEKTDLFDWLPKFSSKMDKIQKCSFNDESYNDDRRNHVVMFKSCYPNSRFVGIGEAPGNPHGPELTLWNAKATLNALLPVFDKQPDTLFVYVTAPPVASRYAPEPAWKWLVKTILRRPQPAEAMQRQASLAREFNNWVKSPDGWLRSYPRKNVVVFDYYAVLTRDEKEASNFLRYATGDGSDSHPSSEGQKKAAFALVPFLNRAVRRAGLSQ